MKNLSLSSIASWIINFVELQLFLTALSLPVLIAWGLPVSLLAIVGNLIFSPFLAAFLLTSSLIFMSEIFGIPNGMLVWLLEKITRLWLALLDSAHQGWLANYPEPSYLLLALLGILPLLISSLPNMVSQKARIGAFFFLLMGTYAALHMFYAGRTREFQIESGAQKPLNALFCARQLVVVESGALARLRTADAWIDYTLMPTIIRHTGNSTINHLVVCTISPRTLEGLCALLAKVRVENLYLPCWQGTMTRAGWFHFYRLHQAAKEHNCTIIRIGTHEKKIKIAHNSFLLINPTGTNIKKHDISLPRFTIGYRIDNDSGTLYDAS